MERNRESVFVRLNGVGNEARKNERRVRRENHEREPRTGSA